MSDAPSPGQPTELQQLEAALAAGAITPELFATLKGKLQPTAPAPVQSPAPAPARVPSPPTEELPSLLDMFSRPPSSAAPAPAPPEVRPAAPPPVAAGPTAQELAARQRIDEHLARLRQVPAAVTPPPLRPEPPAPVFYPEPLPEPPAPAPALAPTFYPETPPPVQAAPPPVAPPRARPTAAPAASASASRSWLIVLLLLAVVGGLAYYFTSSSHPDEELTSTKPAATEAPVAAPPKPKATKSAKAARRTKKRKTKTAPVAAPVAASTADSAQEEDAVADESPAPAPTKPAATATPDFSRPIAAAPEPGDDAAALQVRAAMASYYADLNAPPLHASEHFAPQVERLYIRQNLTPAAIEAELARSFYPDNQHAVCQIEPGTLHVSDLASDGSRTATYVERMRLYRVSLQKYQRLRTQVRVRLNADNKIVYMRQEKLLSNSFEE